MRTHGRVIFLTNTPSIALVTLLAKASPPAVTPYLWNNEYLGGNCTHVGQLTLRGGVYFAAVSSAFLPGIRNQMLPRKGLEDQFSDQDDKIAGK